jgi:DNA repair and recombination protein RAD52
MFTADQNAQLAAPLNRAHVKSRSQGGRGVSYIEGWRAIDEANRIFGFDGWTRETTEIKCVAEREREIGKDKKPGWGVSYIAKVKVVAFAGDTIVTREGVGAGHGIDVDLGQAHESAIKEAETDAMKRALMTFGNPFGLALYDKEQANVADIQDESKLRFLASCDKLLQGFDSPHAVETWWLSKELGDAIDLHGLTADEVAAIKAKAGARKRALTTPLRQAG